MSPSLPLADRPLVESIHGASRLISAGLPTMANRTVKDANSIHGTNPQYLVEKIIRTRIYESKYWKEECFGLTGGCSVLAAKLALASAQANGHS